MRMLLIAAAVGASVVSAGAQSPSKAEKKGQGAAPAAQHVLVTPDSVQWGPAPPVLPAGAQAAVLDGDPSKAGFFTLRLKFPDGYKVPAHTHPTDENITIIQGTFLAGMGDTFSEAGLHEFVAGSFIKMPREMRHFAAAKGETVVQIYGKGPFVVNYVNPNDDPTTKKSTARQ
jgi:quercetin dioxygenase-like cupin family protein